MSGVLLDANVLLALAWPNHQYHAAAHAWFAEEGASAWATCAATQLAFLRWSANPAFTRHPVSPADAARLLARCTAHPGHRFWSEAPAAATADYSRALGHAQIADAYLIALAAHHGGRLATFDARLPALAGPAASRIILLSGTR